MREPSANRLNHLSPPAGSRIGLLGGTFDPPHKGHLALALAALDSGQIDSVWLIPANTPPHKIGVQITAAEHRLAMATLLAGNDPRISVNPVELKLAGKSYTVRTLEILTAQYPSVAFRLIIGADMASDFGLWKNAKEILAIAPPLVADRPGCPLPEDFSVTPPQGLSREDGSVLQAGRFPCPAHDISSTDVRLKLQIQDIHAPCPESLTPEVYSYLCEHKLYIAR